MLFFGAAVFAQAQMGEPDLNFAFSQLKSNGPVPFARALYEADQDAADELVSRLVPMTKHVGEFTGFEIVSRKFLTKRIERVVVAIYFERRPVYLRVDYYETAKGRVCLPAAVSREAADVLPFDLISAAGR